MPKHPPCLLLSPGADLRAECAECGACVTLDAPPCDVARRVLSRGLAPGATLEEVIDGEDARAHLRTVRGTLVRLGELSQAEERLRALRARLEAAGKEVRTSAEEELEAGRAIGRLPPRRIQHGFVEWELGPLSREMGSTPTPEALALEAKRENARERGERARRVVNELQAPIENLQALIARLREVARG